MKKIELIAIGKLKEKYYAQACDEYVKRLGRFCALTVTQLAESCAPDASERESSLILNNIGDGNIILLDKDGESLTSEEFSKSITASFIASPKLTFIIGGSTGVDSRVKDRADRLLSFGRITFPHQLMRVVFLEQLYRALTIEAGMPYHK